MGYKLGNNIKILEKGKWDIICLALTVFHVFAELLGVQVNQIFAGTSVNFAIIQVYYMDFKMLFQI